MPSENVERIDSCELAINQKGKYSGKIKVYSENCQVENRTINMCPYNMWVVEDYINLTNVTINSSDYWFKPNSQTDMINTTMYFC